MRLSARLLAACVLQFAGSGPQFSPPVLYGAIADSFGVEKAHVIATMPAAFAIGTFAFAVPGSLFMERFGLHRSFIFGGVGIALCAVAQALCSSFAQLVLLHGMIGIFKAFLGDVAFVAFC